MKRILLHSLLPAALLLAGAFTANAGKVVTDSLQSKILGSTVHYNVYLPDGFDSSKTKYPVVYLLHGLSDNHNAWIEGSKGQMQDVADELIGTGEACEMIVVMPQAGDADINNVPCGYFNVEGWNYEDFFFSEFVPAVEKKYRAIRDKGHRAVMGLSMGGGGSVVYCQHHPEMFSSCYDMSGWLTNETFGVQYDETVKDRLYYTCKSVDKNSALTFIKNADEKTKSALRSVKWYIDCGDDDFLLDVNLRFYILMRDAGIKTELRVRNGIHNWEYWHSALRTALCFATRNFSK